MNKACYAFAFLKSGVEESVLSVDASKKETNQRK